MIRQTVRKRMLTKLQEVKTELRQRMHDPIPEVGKWLRSVVGGHIRYYGVPCNRYALAHFRFTVGRLWHHVLTRRSQTGRVRWERMKRLIARWLPPAHIHHPYPYPSRRRPVIKIEGGSKRRHQPKVLTPPEISQLLVELQVEPWRTMVFGCLCFGLRLSEICALKWSDFDFDNLLVYIQRANVDGRVDETKTEKSHAAVPLDPDVADIFLSWKLKTKFSEPTDWVFASPFMAGEKPYFPRGLQQHHVRPAAERAGIGRIGTHTFRRTYRTLLGDTDAPLTVQQELMRHADIRTTMNTYGQALEGSKRTANSKVVQMVLSKGIA